MKKKKKKILFTGLFVFMFGNVFSQSNDYINGYTNGFTLAYEMIGQIVANNPSYGLMGGQVPSWQSVPGSYVSYDVNKPSTSMINGFYSFNLTGNYSAYWAGQTVINHFWATGAYSYLLANSTSGDYQLGLYDGFQYGSNQWIIDHQ